MTSTEIRQKAAELIEHHGWVQGRGINRLNDPDGYCLLGALYAVAEIHGGSVSTATEELRRELRTDSLVLWNDNLPPKSKRRVLAVLRRGTS